jgi:hypothetical protein
VMKRCLLVLFGFTLALVGNPVVTGAQGTT